jgi:hypothetical protein
MQFLKCGVAKYAKHAGRPSTSKKGKDERPQPAKAAEQCMPEKQVKSRQRVSCLVTQSEAWREELSS